MPGSNYTDSTRQSLIDLTLVSNVKPPVVGEEVVDLREVAQRARDVLNVSLSQAVDLSPDTGQLKLFE